MSKSKNKNISILCRNCKQICIRNKHRSETYSIYYKRKFCSQKCRYNLQPKQLKTCNICQKEFYVHNYRKKSASYCSYECSGKSKEIIYNKKCPICKKIFQTHIRKKTYCSQKCACIYNNLLQQHHKGLNKLELEGNKILDELNIKYQNQILMFNKFCVDVLIEKFNLIIQWDGIYWHSKPKRKLLDISQDAYLTKCGYKVLRFTDKEVYNNRDEIKNVIRNYI